MTNHKNLQTLQVIFSVFCWSHLTVVIVVVVVRDENPTPVIIDEISQSARQSQWGLLGQTRL